LCFQHLPAIQ